MLAMTCTSPKNVLKSVFGFPQFRPHQESIIEAALTGRDVFAALPTGGGKSLCYQLPAKIRGGLTLVISPLIALMKDQVDAALSMGVEAAGLHGAMTPDERHAVYQALEQKQVRLLYMAPERLMLDGTIERLKEWGCSAIAVDEAHCISEWGHEFRPEYRQLSRIKEWMPNIPVTAFTATATQRVQDDILEQLGLQNPMVIRAGFDRPEIHYRIESKRDPLLRITEFVKKRPHFSGIIYRSTRADVEKTAAYLQDRGIFALPYHAGLPDEVRQKNQEAFKTDQVNVMVATVAFGMGIDKPDIRYVVHGDLPKSLEAYYQETGRAGRDGDSAEALLLWNAGDLAKIRYHFQRLSDVQERERSEQSLRRMTQFAGSFCCRRQSLLAHFDETHPGECGNCDVCQGEVESVDATVDAQKYLSAIIRTGERYGAHYIVDVVRGTNSENVLQRGHQDLPTFGVGADSSRRYWLALSDDLEARGHLYRDEERYKALVITNSGKEILFGQQEFRTMKRSKVSPSQTKRLSLSAQEEELQPGDMALWEALKNKRTDLAKEAGKPPYMVFPDRTLRAFARLRPHTATELLSCPGVGEKKLATWGTEFLAVIRDFEEGTP